MAQVPLVAQLRARDLANGLAMILPGILSVENENEDEDENNEDNGQNMLPIKNGQFDLHFLKRGKDGLHQ